MKPRLLPVLLCGLLPFLFTEATTITAHLTNPEITTTAPTSPSAEATTTTSTTTPSTTRPASATSSSEVGDNGSSSSDAGVGRGIGIGIGIMLALVALAAAVVTYFLWRRQWKLDLSRFCFKGFPHKHHDSEQSLERPADSHNGGAKVYSKPPKEAPGAPAAQAEAKPRRTEAASSGCDGDDPPPRHSSTYEAPNPAYVDEVGEKYEPLTCHDADNERESMTYEDPVKSSHNTHSSHNQTYQPQKLAKDKTESAEGRASLSERRPPEGGIDVSEGATDDDFYVNYDDTARPSSEPEEGPKGRGQRPPAPPTARGGKAVHHGARPDETYVAMDGTGHGQQRAPSNDDLYMNYDVQSGI